MITYMNLFRLQIQTLWRNVRGADELGFGNDLSRSIIDFKQIIRRGYDWAKVVQQDHICLTLRNSDARVCENNIKRRRYIPEYRNRSISCPSSAWGFILTPIPPLVFSNFIYLFFLSCTWMSFGTCLCRWSKFPREVQGVSTSSPVLRVWRRPGLWHVAGVRDAAPGSLSVSKTGSKSPAHL